MSRSKPLSGTEVTALMRFAGIEIDLERAETLAIDSDSLFAEADEVSAFMAPRREVGPAVYFSHLIGREGRP